MPVRISRNISLTPELDAFVGARVSSGEYQTASEVVRAALRLLRDRERRGGRGRAGGPSVDKAKADA